MAGALDGIRVLDLCIILAGPTCGRTLAEYGADVIKIDVEHRKPRLTPWIDVGRGKRKVLLWVSAALLLGFSAVGIFSIGLFYLPAALALIVSAVMGSRRMPSV